MITTSPTYVHIICQKLPDTPFTLLELADAISKIKPDKAPGPDGIPGNLLKYLPENCLLALLDLFNRSLASSSLPSSLLNGVIAAFVKPGGSPDYLTSYRPITLLNSSLKLFESLIVGRLEQKLLPFIHDEQGGFQRKRGSRDQIFVLSETISHSIAAGQPLFLAFLDIKKAFDSVWHDGLFSKLFLHGIVGNTWSLLRHIYSNLTVQLRLSDTELTDPFNPPTGTAQGSLLSPLFYLLFINDLITDIKKDPSRAKVGDHKLSCLLLADDIVLLAPSVTDLRHLFTIVDNFASKSHITLNPTKCGALSFPHIHTPNDTAGFIGTTRIPWVDHYKYLGITLSSATDHFLDMEVSLRINAARSAGDVIYAAFSPNTARIDRYRAYRSHSEPKLDYCAEVLAWTPRQLAKLAAAEAGPRGILSRIGSLEHLDPFLQRLAAREDKFVTNINQLNPRTWRHRLLQLRSTTQQNHSITYDLNDLDNSWE
eukprot:Lithocolla_globosa_v1_NODE_1063_length_2901_cov_6.565355.p2 type:complete len:483 gc:universal NODE_1063_length_2901_cov_6.565355:1501-53(-)